MKTLYVAATHLEVKNTLEVVKYQEIKPNLFQFSEQAYLLITGVGLLNTATSLGFILQHLTVDQIVNIGLGGVYANAFPIGDLVEVVQDGYGDLGIDDNGNFVPAGEIGLLKEQKISVTPAFPNLKKSKAISVNEVAGSEELISQRLRLFAADVESMEGMAVFAVGKQWNIPCNQVRAISNRVEPRNKDNWEIEKALKVLNDFLTKEIRTRI